MSFAVPENGADLRQVTLLETYPQIIGYDPEVFNYFKEQ